MMSFVIQEWAWQKPKKSERLQATFCCPYCNGTVTVDAETRIVDIETGAIHFHIYKCPQCHMPVTRGLDGRIIPPSQFLPFDDIAHLPEKIEKMYRECRQSFLGECFYSVVMVARSLMMHIAIDKGATTNQRFIKYVEYLQANGYIAEKERIWVDKIRELGNRYIHETDEATKTDAHRTIVFIGQLLKNIYELPKIADAEE